MTFSIIMPKYSILIPIIKSRFLSIAIESVLKQTFSDWEMVLYDDCSPEDIDSVVEKFKDDRIRYHKGEKNLGAEDPSMTWNKMLELAKGEFVCLLGDDDYISENFLEEIDKLIAKYPEIDLFRTGIEKVNEDNETIMPGETLPEIETWDEMMYQRNVKKRLQCTTGFVLRKKALQDIGGYVNFPRACGSDDATYLLLAKKNGIAATNKAFGYWRKSTLNISDNESDEVSRKKVKFYLKWEKEFLDRNNPSEIYVDSLYQALQKEMDYWKKNGEAQNKPISSANIVRKIANFFGKK